MGPVGRFAAGAWPRPLSDDVKPRRRGFAGGMLVAAVVGQDERLGMNVS